jgi:hypothetical protein
VWLPEDGKYRSKPSMDLLFETASDSFGEQLIAVVLWRTLTTELTPAEQDRLVARVPTYLLTHDIDDNHGAR